MNCQADWFEKFGDQAVNHFGRIHQPLKLTQENAWYKDYDWRNGTGDYPTHYFVNDLLGQRIPITQQQYNDKSLVRP